MGSLLRWATRFGPDLLSLKSVGRTIGFAAAVGMAAGIAAIGLQILSQYVVYGFLETLAGYVQTMPASEPRLLKPVPDPQLRLWMLALAPIIGALIAGWVIYRWAPETAGGGADAAIDAFHRHDGRIRARVPIIKMIATALTLGTGGSGGREGPISQIGAGVGSILADRLRLSSSDRRILMTAGLGAGIGAIFHVPLAGAMYAIEVLYRDPDFETDALIPSFIATIVAYCVYNVFFGLVLPHEIFEPYQSLFQVTDHLEFRNPLLLVPLTVLAVVMVFASLGFVRTYNYSKKCFSQMNIRPWLKPAIGAAGTGITAVLLYLCAQYFSQDAAFSHSTLNVMGFGYGVLQQMLSGDFPWVGGPALALLAILAVGKILTTSLTIGSGGSGGVFGPSMVIGGCLGMIVYLLCRPMIPADVSPAVFVILGMAAFFAAAANTPVSTLIMVSELTASYELLLPAMWVCALSYLLSRGWTIYPAQVSTRLQSPAHRGEYVIDVLQGLTVNNALHTVGRQFVSILPGMLLHDVVHLFTDTRQSCFPVVDREGRYYGLFGINDVRQFLYDSEIGALAVALDLATPAEPLATTMDLHTAIERFASCRFDELPVIDPKASHAIVGLLRRQDLIAVYNSKLMALRTPASDVAHKG